MTYREKLLAAMDIWAEYLADCECGKMSFPEWIGWKFHEEVGK